MSSSSTSVEAVTKQLIGLEEERCRAFRELDEAAMAALLSDDYTHVHMNGHMEEKDAFMAALKSRQRSITRGDLKVRVHGDAAIMTGRMYTTRQTANGSEVIDSFTTQTWINQDGSWKLAAMQVCPYTP